VTPIQKTCKTAARFAARALSPQQLVIVVVVDASGAAVASNREIPPDVIEATLRATADELAAAAGASSNVIPIGTVPQ
jgi:hypothetical protein